jgi:DNA-binding GntR family transcriptional regulator
VATAKPKDLKLLATHVRRQHQAIDDGDNALRTHLLMDFHIQFAELTGNGVLVRIVRDLTMRTNLILMLYQTGQEASESAHEHEELLRAIVARDADEAARLMAEHLAGIERGLSVRRSADQLNPLREALSMQPSDASQSIVARKRGEKVAPRLREKAVSKS